MELRVNLKCRIVCVYLTRFSFFWLKGNLCPLPVLGIAVPSKCRLVCVCLTCFRFVIKGPSVPFLGFGTICTHEHGFIYVIPFLTYNLLLLLFISFLFLSFQLHHWFLTFICVILVHSFIIILFIYLSN